MHPFPKVPFVLMLCLVLPAVAFLRAPVSPVRPSIQARELHVAAAADLSFAMDEMLREFNLIHPEIHVRVSYGSSGNFYSQISNSAPFDLFFSADTAYPQKLAEQGMALDGSTFPYAVGRLVLWAPNGFGMDLKREGVEALRSEATRHIAIANPMHAPYGKAAEAYLRAAGVYEAVRSKLVYGENVAQALQFVQSGAAEVGLIACSLALSPEVKDRGRFWEIPRDKYPRIDQSGIILKRTKDPAAASELRSFFLSRRGREVLAQYGFSLPGD